MIAINYNDALTSNFKITFPGIPNLEFRALSVNIPTIQLSPIEMAYQDTRAKLPDNRYVWDDLTIQFLMDENLYTYELIRDWMVKVRDRTLWQDGIKDINVIPLDSSKQREYSFLASGAWPNMISGWQYTHGNSGSEVITFDVTFSYQDFQISRIKPLEFSIVGAHSQGR